MDFCIICSKIAINESSYACTMSQRVGVFVPFCIKTNKKTNKCVNIKAAIPQFMNNHLLAFYNILNLFGNVQVFGDSQLKATSPM